MFTLTKVLSLFVYPLSLGVFLIGLSFLGQLRGNRAAAGLYTFFALMVLYYPSTEFGVEAIASRWKLDTRRFPQKSSPTVTPLLYWVVVLKPRESMGAGQI